MVCCLSETWDTLFSLLQKRQKCTNQEEGQALCAAPPKQCSIQSKANTFSISTVAPLASLPLANARQATLFRGFQKENRSAPPFPQKPSKVFLTCDESVGDTPCTPVYRKQGTQCIMGSPVRNVATPTECNDTHCTRGDNKKICVSHIHEQTTHNGAPVSSKESLLSLTWLRQGFSAQCAPPRPKKDGRETTQPGLHVQ